LRIARRYDEFWVDGLSGVARWWASDRSKPVQLRMSITKERKTELIGEFGRDDKDAGSPEVQIAVLSSRIETLTRHLNRHKTDHAGRRGLLMLVSRRRRLLNYLRRTDPECYRTIIGQLGIRK